MSYATFWPRRSIKIVKSLTDGDFTEAAEPFALFSHWFSEATASEPNDPNAMALATVDPDGLPNVRMVLMKGWDEAGFVFYTNTESAKGRELLSGKKAALVLHWKSLRRQVRVRGPVETVSDAEADEYFRSRPRDSRIGDWTGFRIRPVEIEFWQDKPFRLHDRVVFRRSTPEGGWSKTRLYP